MYQTINRFRAMLFVMTALVLGSSGLFATEVPIPKELRADMYSSNPAQAMLMWWMHDGGMDNPELCRVYLAEGETKDLSKFKMVSEFDPKNLKDRKDPMAYAIIDLDLNKVYSFYVTNVYNQVESSHSNFAFISTKIPVYVKFSSAPPETGIINKEYTYELKAEASDGSKVEFTLGMSPDGAKMSDAGVITWTPNHAGIYNFTVHTNYSQYNNYNNSQSWQVYVSSCETPGSLTGTITDTEGVAIPKGELKLFTLGSKDKAPGYYGYIKEGKFEFTNLDSGSYVLAIMLPNAEVIYYLNANNYKEATLIQINCGETKAISFEINPVEYVKRFMVIKSQPVISAKKNVEYSYQLEVETSAKKEDIRFELQKSPDGAKISDKGLVTFTPTESGTYYFTARVFEDKHNESQDYQQWAVRVRKCEVPAKVTATIKYENGELVPYGYIQSSGKIKRENDSEDFLYIKFENGKTEFELDEGTYYLMFADKNNMPIWYKDGTNPENATPFEVKCGETYNIEMTLKEYKKPVNHTISGHVFQASDNAPVKFAMVEFYGTGANGETVVLMRTTKEDGSYVAEIPDNFTYIVRASVYPDSIKGNMPGYNLLPMFYNQVTDPAEAQTFTMTQNFDGIDFFLAERPKYDNSIAGMVKNVENEAITNAYVIAFMVETVPQFKDMLYISRTTTTDANGGFKLENLIPGKYVLLTYDKVHQKYTFMPGFYLEGKRVTMYWDEATKLNVVEDSKIADLVITVEKMEARKGRCNIFGGIAKKGKKGKVSEFVSSQDALPGAIIYVTDSDGNLAGVSISGNDGTFNIDNLDKGEYKLIISKVGYETSSTNVSVDDSKTTAEASFDVDAKATSVIDNNGNDVEALANPNPANEYVNLVFSTVQGTADIRIVNTMGEQVSLANMTTTTGLNSYKLNVGNLPTGAYYARITIGTNTFAIPFIVQR